MIGPITDDTGALVQEVAADDLAIALGHHPIEARMVDHHTQQSGGDFDGREVVREPVFVVDRAKCIVADTTAIGSIIWRGRTYRIHRPTLHYLARFHSLIGVISPWGVFTGEPLVIRVSGVTVMD